MTTSEFHGYVWRAWRWDTLRWCIVFMVDLIKFGCSCCPLNDNKVCKLCQMRTIFQPSCLNKSSELGCPIELVHCIYMWLVCQSSIFRSTLCLSHCRINHPYSSKNKIKREDYEIQPFFPYPIRAWHPYKNSLKSLHKLSEILTNEIASRKFTLRESIHFQYGGSKHNI